MGHPGILTIVTFDYRHETCLQPDMTIFGRRSRVIPIESLPLASPRLSSRLHALLSDRERMFDSLLANLDGMAYCCLCDADWTMVFVSSGGASLTGYPVDDLLFNRRVSYEQITHPADRERVRETVVNQARQGLSFDAEYRIYHADGSIRWVWERGCPLLNEKGEVEALEGFIQDITLRKRSEDAAREAEERYRSIFENAMEGIYQTSPSGAYLNFNPSLARIYGYDTPQDLADSISDIQRQLYVDPGKRDEFIALMQAYGQVQNFEAQVYRKNGDIIWISENAREVRGAEGNLLFYEGTVEDITERKNYEQQIEYQATHDSLTGLPNRTLLVDRLQQCMSFAERYQTKVAVAFLDLDQFKIINDTLGHHVGDDLLVMMAERLQQCVRESDTVVRLGGDEFVVLITGLKRTGEVALSMNRILDAIAQPQAVRGWDYAISCSIGVSLYPDDSTDANTLLKYADTAMYKAKQAGRNNFQFYTRELNDVMMARLDLEYRLRQAIENREFQLYYQPKVAIDSGRICGAEALIRWHTADGAVIPPAQFIPVAEETGQIEEIGRWVMATACAKARELRELLGYPLPIAVNVSPRQFRLQSVADMVECELALAGTAPQCLELEITESLLMDGTEQFIDTLRTLKGLGVSLAIDDFGTGYSSLAYLKHFPIDRLKIDKAFVDDLEHDPADRAILGAIVALGQSLGVKVVAEGVETRYQRDFLSRIGCDELQGYYYSRPVTAEALTAMLVAQSAAG
jgi:diguanylate cyclase (GGDEF)-like protein/PAS domain S-box-containing protein